MKATGIDLPVGRLLLVLTCLFVTTIQSAPSTAYSCADDIDELLELELVEVIHDDEVVSDLSVYRLDELSYAVSTAGGGGHIVFIAHEGDFEEPSDDRVPNGAYGEFYYGENH